MISSRKSRTDCASAADGGGLFPLVEPAEPVAVFAAVVREPVGPVLDLSAELDVERGIAPGAVDAAVPARFEGGVGV